MCTFILNVAKKSFEFFGIKLIISLFYLFIYMSKIYSDAPSYILIIFIIVSINLAKFLLIFISFKASILEFSTPLFVCFLSYFIDFCS